MSVRITVEDIGRLYRRGSDIDLEAIYQGHLSGKHTQNGKVNPVFLDALQQQVTKGDSPEHFPSNGIVIHVPLNSIRIENEESSFKEIKSQEHVHITMEKEVEIHETSENLEKMASRQDSLKVTNGEVCIGDIVIENGYKNPAFEPDSDGLYEVIKDIEQTKYDASDMEIQNSKDLGESKTKMTSDESVTNSHSQDTVLSFPDEKIQQSDWPELDELVSEDVDHNQNQKDVLNSVKNNSDSESTSEGKGDNCVTVMSSSMLVKVQHADDTNPNLNDLLEQVKNEKNSPKNSKIDSDTLSNNVLQSSDKKVHKSILIMSGSVEDDDEHDPKKQNGTVHEHKSVKFTDDTVDNEEKPKKYKKEKIFVSNIYRGKISNDNAVAKSNPIFLDDDGFEKSLTDDEKAARYSFRKIRNGDGQHSSELNIPAYMQEYVIATGQMTPTSLSNTKLKIDGEIENLGEVPAGYDKLIKKTIAKERRNKIIRLTLAILAFLVVIAAVVLIVVFLGSPKS